MTTTHEKDDIYHHLIEERKIAASTCAHLLHNGCDDEARSYAAEWASLTNDIAALSNQGNKK